MAKHTMPVPGRESEYPSVFVPKKDWTREERVTLEEVKRVRHALRDVMIEQKIGEPREPLDAIDLAYLQLERPLLVLRVPAESTQHQNKSFLEQLEKLTRFPCVVLPQGYDLQVIGPSYTSAPPFELARWADDGGRV